MTYVFIGKTKYIGLMVCLFDCYVFVHILTYLSVYLSVHWFIYSCIYHLLIHLSIYSLIYLSICLFMCACTPIRYKHSTWYGGFQPAWKVVESEVSYPRRACTRLEIMAPQRARTPFLGSRNSKRSPSWKFITCIDGPYIGMHAACMYIYRYTCAYIHLCMCTFILPYMFGCLQTYRLKYLYYIHTYIYTHVVIHAWLHSYMVFACTYFLAFWLPYFLASFLTYCRALHHIASHHITSH